MISEERKISTDWAIIPEKCFQKGGKTILTGLPSLKNVFRREEKQHWLGYHPRKMFSEGRKNNTDWATTPEKCFRREEKLLTGLPWKMYQLPLTELSSLKNVFKSEEKQNWLGYHPWKMFSEERKNSTDWAIIPEKCFQKGGKTELTELPSLKNVFRREEKHDWLGYHPWKMFSEERKNSTDWAIIPEKCFQKGGKTELTELPSLKNVFRREEKHYWLGYHPWKMFSEGKKNGTVWATTPEKCFKKGEKTALTELSSLKNVFRREEKQNWLGYHPWKMFSEERKNRTDWAIIPEKCFQKGGKTELTWLPSLKNDFRREKKQYWLGYHPWKMFSEGRKKNTDWATTPEKCFQKGGKTALTGLHPWKMFSEGRKNSTDRATTPEKCFQKGGKTITTGHHPWKMFQKGGKTTDWATTPEKCINYH